MGQKHSAKYSLKPSSPSSKQQTAQIEDEVAFNTDSPGRAPDEPVGVNLSSQENDYIRNAAQAMAKVWTENTAVESGGGINERGREEKEKESPNDGNKTMLKEIEAELLEKKNEPKMTEIIENEPNKMEEDGTNVPDKPCAKIEAKEPKKNDDKKHEEKTEQSMPNNEAKNDAIQNVVEQKISQEESNLTHSAAADDVSHLQQSEEPIIHQTQCEENAAILGEQIVSNPVNSDDGAYKQKIVGVHEIQPREQGVDEAKIDLYEENGQNELTEIDKNKEENGINSELLETEMPNQNNMEETMEKCVEEYVQKNEKKEVEGQNNFMDEIGKQQNPALEGIADYVANQQTVQIDGNGTEEEMNGDGAEPDARENFVPIGIGNQNGEEKGNEHRQTEMEGEVVEDSKILLVENADPILTENKAISSAQCENEFGEVKQNEHQNECQELPSGYGEEEPTCTGKPSEL